MQALFPKLLSPDLFKSVRRCSERRFSSLWCGPASEPAPLRYRACPAAASCVIVTTGKQLHEPCSGPRSTRRVRREFLATQACIKFKVSINNPRQILLRKQIAILALVFLFPFVGFVSQPIRNRFRVAFFCFLRMHNSRMRRHFRVTVRKCRRRSRPVDRLFGIHKYPSITLFPSSDARQINPR